MMDYRDRGFILPARCGRAKGYEMPKQVKHTDAAAPQTDSREASRKGSWWQTLLGMLTAITAIITAVAGLLVALHQVGLLGGDTPPSPQSVPATTSQQYNATLPPAVPAANNTNYLVTFPSGTAVNFRTNRGQGNYQILAAQAERRSVGKLGLTFTIRMTNNGPADVGFHTDTFRLLVDGVPRAPVNQLIDSVDARSAKESTIEFEMPETFNTLALQVLVGDKQEDVAIIAITLE